MTRRAPDGGVTLVEMLVALSLFALVGLASFATLDAIVKSRERTEGRLAAITDIDRALLIFGRDLAQADPGTVAGDEGAIGVGPQDARTVWALAEGTLVRRRDDILRDAPGPEQSLISGIEGLRLRYLDAARVWHDGWPVEETADALIGVELMLDRGAGTGTVRKLVALVESGS